MTGGLVYFAVLAAVPVAVSGFRGVYELGRAFSGQTSLADFVEQGAITDFELAGGTLAIPAIGFESAQDDFALEIMDGLAGNFFEMDGAVGG